MLPNVVFETQFGSNLHKTQSGMESSDLTFAISQINDVTVVRGDSPLVGVAASNGILWNRKWTGER